MDEPQHRELVAHEMQRVRHHHAVERWQVERPGEVGDELVQDRAGEAASQGSRLLAQGGRVAIDGPDRPARPEEVGQGKREGTRPGSQVGPRRAPFGHAVGDESDVIRVVHRVGVAIRIPQV